MHCRDLSFQVILRTHFLKKQKKWLIKHACCYRTEILVLVVMHIQPFIRTFLKGVFLTWYITCHDLQPTKTPQDMHTFVRMKSSSGRNIPHGRLTVKIKKTNKVARTSGILNKFCLMHTNQRMYISEVYLTYRVLQTNQQLIFTQYPPKDAKHCYMVLEWRETKRIIQIVMLQL